MTKDEAIQLVDREGNYLSKNSGWIHQDRKIISYKNVKYHIHRLVALAYGDKDIENMDIHHIDCNKLNNHIDNLMILTKGEHSKIHKNCVSTKPRRKLFVKVNQLTKSGKFIRLWDSITEASTKLNINNGHISSVCKGNRKSSGGYIWEYV